MTEKVYLCSRTKFDLHVSVLSARHGISEKHVLDFCTWLGNEEGSLFFQLVQTKILNNQ